MKNNLFNRIFHSKELKAYLKEQEEIKMLDDLVPEFLDKLSKCDNFQNLVDLHKEIVANGFEYDTNWNFSNKPIEDITVEDLTFYAYDRDSCIHGKDLLYLERSPNNSDWLNWSYWVNYDWYTKSLYKVIKYHHSGKNGECPETKCPTACKNFFKVNE